MNIKNIESIRIFLIFSKSRKYRDIFQNIAIFSKILQYFPTLILALHCVTLRYVAKVKNGSADVWISRCCNSVRARVKFVNRIRSLMCNKQIADVQICRCRQQLTLSLSCNLLV